MFYFDVPGYLYVYSFLYNKEIKTINIQNLENEV